MPGPVSDGDWSRFDVVCSSRLPPDATTPDPRPMTPETPATTDTDHLRRIARQHVETTGLLGVDFVPVRPGDSPAKALEALRSRHDAECPHCTTATGHTRTVFGEGNPDAALMFVGEAPGQEEDRTGRPFVGRAGEMLDKIIKAMGLRRQDVYIANVLKSRPPDNRTPLPTEVEACSPYLAEQIRLIRPSVLVSLGNPSTKFLLRTNLGITRLRGSWATYSDGSLSIPLMPTFHPAYLLRDYTPETRNKVWSDMQAVMQQLGIRAE